MRVARIDGKLVLNPTNAERDKSDIDLIVAGTEDAICMVEGGARELPEKTIIDAIFFGHDAVKLIVAAQKELAPRLGLKKPVTGRRPTLTRPRWAPRCAGPGKRR